MIKKILILLLSIISWSLAAATPSTVPLTVILDWFPNPDHAPLFVAEEEGFFKEAGLQVKLIGPADPNDPPKWVAAKKADVAITYEPQLMEQIDNGLPLISIGTLIDKPLNCLVTIDEQITSLSQLKGKRIGSTSGGLSSVMLKVMLSKQGLTEKDVELINVRYNLTQALLSKKVDAVTGLMRNFEIPQLKMSGHKVNAFFPEEHGIPNYSELIFVVHLDHRQDPRFPKFLAALKKAVIYLKKHPQKTWEQFAKLYPENNNALNRAAWMITIPYFSNHPAEFNIQEWKHFSEFMLKEGLIKNPKPISRYAIVLH